MSYIGNIPLPQSTEARTSHTVTSGESPKTSFTVSYVPGYLDLFINGVLQDPATDYSATNGTSVTLTSGAVTGDIVSFIARTQTSALMALPLKDSAGNNVLSESGGAVTLANASVGESFSGIMEIDQWILNQDCANSDPVINWDRITDHFTSAATVGTGLVETSANSGIFKFPRTGIYLILMSALFQESTGNEDANVAFYLKVSTDNGSNYDTVAGCIEAVYNTSGHAMSSNQYLLNVNDITYSGSNGVLIKFAAASLNTGNYLEGSTADLETNFLIQRLGPAQ